MNEEERFELKLSSARSQKGGFIVSNQQICFLMKNYSNFAVVIDYLCIDLI